MAAAVSQTSEKSIGRNRMQERGGGAPNLGRMGPNKTVKWQRSSKRRIDYARFPVILPRRTWMRDLTVSSMNKKGLAIKSLPPAMVEFVRLSKSLSAVTKR